MKRFLKWFIIILVTLVILFFGTAVGALLLLDPNEFKDDISQLVKDKTGRDLMIQGNVEVAIFPWLGFEIGKTQLSNAPGFGKEPMVAFEHAEARVKLLSLFSGEPQIATLVLKDFEARLARNAKGKTNWADLQKLGAVEKPEAEKKQPEAVPSEPSQLIFPRVEGIRIEQAKLHWRDALNNQQAQLTQLNLTTGTVALKQSIPLKLNFQLQSSNPAIRGKVELKAAAWADMATQRFRIDNLRLQPQLQGEMFPHGQLDAALEAQQVQLDADQQILAVEGLQAQYRDVIVNGLIGMRNFAQPRITFTLNSNTINIDKLLPPAKESSDEAPVPASPAGAALLPLEVIRPLNIDGQLSVERLIVSNLTVSEMQLQVKAADGLLQLVPSAALYGGTYQGDIRVDARNKLGKVSMQESLSKVNVGPLLKDFLNKDYIRGQTNLQLTATAKGNTLDSMMATLEGLANLKITDAELLSKHVLYDVAQAIAKKKQLSKPENYDKQVTVFDTITGDFNIKDGIATNDELLAISKRVHIRGKGKVNLIKKTLDYTAYLIPKVSLPIPFVGGDALDLKDQPIPYHVHGPLNNLQYDADFEEVLKRLTKARLNAIKEQKEAELRQKLEAEKRQLEEKKAREKAKLEAQAQKEKEELEAKAAKERQELEEKAAREKKELKEKTEKEKQQLQDKLKEELFDKLR